MYQVIFYITLFIGIIPSLLLLKENRIYSRHAIIPLVILIALATLYEFIGTKIFKINTMYWFQVYPIFEFGTLYYFFSHILSDYKRLFKASLFLAIIFYCISFFYWSGDNIFISLAINRSFISFFVLVFSLIWYKNQFDRVRNIDLFETIKSTSLWQNATFYFISGVFIYYCTTFFLFFSSSFIFESKLYFYDFWLVNVLATLFYRIILIIGVWKMNQD